jgi:hypothetical protein
VLTTTHLVSIDAEDAIVGHCEACGQQFMAANAAHFRRLVEWHQAEEAEAETDAARTRHPSSRRIHEPKSTPMLNRWST